MSKQDLRNFSLDQLESFLEGMGLSSSRAKQVFYWLYQPGIYNFSQMTDIKAQVRNDLGEYAVISSLEPIDVEVSTDGTHKFVFHLKDGAVIESVLIPGEGRYTLCLSSQSGCAMGCKFCLTGKMGFVRNLEPGEIVNQVMAVLKYMVTTMGEVRSTPRELVNNLVFMGMGEPLANYQNLLCALDILMNRHGLEFTERRVTVSTCGLVSKINDLGRDTRVNLAISLHAASDEVRSSLMPVNMKYGVDELLAACRDYPLSRKKIILFEYIMFKDLNDSIDDANLLARKLKGISCRINLLPYNESSQLPYRCSSDKTIKEFQNVLRSNGYTALIRNSRGADISAACGQLAGKRKA